MPIDKNGKQEEMPCDVDCKICNQPGDILMCDNCPSVFHLECLGLKVTIKNSLHFQL